MPRLVAAVDRVTKVALCQLPSWRPVAGKRPGLLSGWQSPDHRRSAYVAHVTVAATGATSEERLQSGRRAALALIGQRLPGHDLRFVAPASGAFMHLDWEQHTTYAFRGGLCDVGWGYARNDNSVIVGAVCGPPSWIGLKDQLAIANSFARI
jgi:hypothetical protein